MTKETKGNIFQFTCAAVCIFLHPLAVAAGDGASAVNFDASTVTTNAQGILTVELNHELSVQDTGNRNAPSHPEQEHEEEEEQSNEGTFSSSCFDEIGSAACQALATEIKMPMRDTCIHLFGVMRDVCAQTCQVCQQPDDTGIANLYSDDPQVMGRWANEDPQAFVSLIKAVDQYMYDQVYMQKDSIFANVQLDCRNRHESCTEWALEGECNANSKYMQTWCAPACQTCELLDMDIRCPFDPDTAPDPIWSQPGDLNANFARIVLRGPVYGKNVTVLSNNPWVVLIDDFLSDYECDLLIRWGARLGYERSMDVGEMNFDGTYAGSVNDQRTSSNAWCEGGCMEDTAEIHDRLYALTKIPPSHYEHFQLLKYELGEFYRTHHDYIEMDVKRMPGPRILTIFFYLNDVEKGGGTNFPRIHNLTVTPKRGRAVLWPSVLDEAPMEIDDRTDHQALPVLAGIKYGANAWVHAREFKEAFERGCI